ncbi:hypothetical protein RAB80_011034 [Fusarium oxysporum f. sp. vasinfectum]|nr:hypothetical protein RAB80_011034 [Fusarium oxysporum f. sp. vasinfectum]
MADHDSTNSLYSLQDPNLGGFVDDGSVVKSDPSSTSLPNDSSRPQTQQQYYDAAWQFTGTPPYDSYDPSSSTAPPAQTSYQPSPWNLAFGQDQQNLQQLPISTGIDGLPATTLSPESIYAASNPSLRQASFNDNTVLQPALISHLTPALQEKLRNIAMPPHLQYHSPKSASSPDSANGELRRGVFSSPDPADGSSKASRKRKSSADPEDEEEEEEDGDQPVKKTAHNMIEKRYRTNLNDKIAALRDSVPSLRIMSKSARGEDTTEDREELHGLTPAHKLNKATVLSKATEYIRHLEKRNNRLLDENGAMQARIAAFEKLFMAGAMNGAISPLQQPPTPIQYAQDAQQFVGGPSQDGNAQPGGMIQVPDDMKRIITQQMASGQPYPVPQQQFRGRWNNAGPYFGKLMVGSLAGLMILEAMREDEVSNEKPEGRGLFAMPIQLLKSAASGLDLTVGGYHLHTSLRIILLLGTFLWVFVPSLFTQAPQKSKKPQVGVLQAAPSLASPIHVRRQAWLTAIQTVWVPRHNFFLEAAALILKTLKLSLRNAIGVHGYQAITGLTQEQETARVQAWSIALDSQLAGGDVEINKSRLILTLLASGTLPDTPARLMLKALHIRVLLWDLSQNRLQLGAINIVAAKLARSKWNEARQLNRLLTQLHRESSEQHDDDLPEHLALLVEQDCDEVLNDDVIQRAHNLAFNTDTDYNVVTPMDGMDSVVDDTAIGSPLDAVAAWWSTQFLHRTLVATLEKDEETLSTKVEDIELTIKAAPLGSTAQARAIVARAVLVDKARGANIASALQSMGNEKVDALLSSSICVVDSSFQASTPDLRLALRCAMAIAHLRRVECTPGSTHQGLRMIESIMTRGNALQMSLLGCTATLELMEELYEHKSAAETFQASLERLSGGLRLWMGGSPGEKCGVASDVREKVVSRCLAINKSVVGIDSDTGYGSLDECEDDGC